MFNYCQLHKQITGPGINEYDEGPTQTKLLNTFSHTIHKFPSLNEIRNSVSILRINQLEVYL